MKMIAWIVLGLCIPLTTQANIYSWDTGDLLTTLDPEPYTDFMGLTLSFAYMTGVNVSHSNMEYVALDSAYLNNADLSSVNLRFSDLRYAYLKNSLFINADLSKADLRYCDFDKAVFRGANLSGANLSIAPNWNKCDFYHALYDEVTQFPASFDPVSAGMIFIPEPASFLLVVAGAINIACIKKRRSRR